jgi:hypothetical protein
MHRIKIVLLDDSYAVSLDGCPPTQWDKEELIETLKRLGFYQGVDSENGQ